MDNKFVYSNMVNISTSPFDFQFNFYTKGGNGETVIDIDLPTVVAMSPQHAKVLSVVLARTLEEYEKNIGTININIAEVSKGESDGQ